MPGSEMAVFGVGFDSEMAVFEVDFDSEMVVFVHFDRCFSVISVDVDVNNHDHL